MSDYDYLEPVPCAGLSDYHCHCEYSADAVGTIDQYCEAALRRNLVELCFTTHFDIPSDLSRAFEIGCCIRIDNQLYPTAIDLLEPYVEEVRRANQKFHPQGLAVKAGVEFGWYRGCEETVVRLNEKYDLDYLLCGVHTIDDEYIEHVLENTEPEKVAEIYFRDVLTAVNSGLFDTLAHLDYYRKTGERLYGDRMYEIHKPYMATLCQALVDSDTSLEINTRALMNGLKEYFPRMAIVNEARRLGVDIRYLGSDAHDPADVAFDFETAVNILPPFVVDDEG